MNDKENLRKALVELLGEEDTRRGKRFYFPRNVSNEYCIVPGITFKDLCKFMLPAALASLFLFAIPPYHIFSFIVIKAVIAFFIITIAFSMMMVRPIPNRKNVRVSNYMKYWFSYCTRQRIFYMEKKMKCMEGELSDGRKSEFKNTK